MKKITLLLAFFVTLLGFSQKTFEIYNFTGQTLDMADIITKVNTSALYPEYHSKPFLLIPVPPGGSYTLTTTDTFRFPFNSTASTPVITNWERLNNPSSVTPVTSAVAFSLGASQVFTRLMFFLGGNYFGLQTVVPGVTTAPNAVPALNSYGYQLDYDCSNPTGNVWYYTIVVY